MSRASLKWNPPADRRGCDKGRAARRARDGRRGGESTAVSRRMRSVRIRGRRVYNLPVHRPYQQPHMRKMLACSDTRAQAVCCVSLKPRGPDSSWMRRHPLGKQHYTNCPMGDPGKKQQKGEDDEGEKAPKRRGSGVALTLGNSHT